MNQTKQQKLIEWREALEPFNVESFNKGTHLRFYMGRRRIDVWPTTGKYGVNNGQVKYAKNPHDLLQAVEATADTPPEKGPPPFSMRPKQVTQIKVFTDTIIDGQLGIDRLNSFLVDNENVEYVDLKVVAINEGLQEVIYLVYKIEIE